MSTDDPTVTILTCSVCHFPLVDSSDIIVEKAPNLKAEAVYAYTLDDICGLDAVATYSATNPAERRFDVVRVRTTAAMRGSIECTGREPSPDHSWFPPHEWNMASCAKCGQSIGWGFYQPAPEPSEAPSAAAASSEASVARSEPSQAEGGDNGVLAPGEEKAEQEDDDDDDEDDADDDSDGSDDSGASGPAWSRGVCVRPLQFIGLIVTNCVPKDLPQSQTVFPPRDAIENVVRIRREYLAARTEVMRKLRGHSDQLAASRLAAVIRRLDGAPDFWEHAMPQVVQAAEQLITAATPDVTT